MQDELNEVSDDSFQKKIIDDKGVVLVDFYADWCKPCKILHNIIKELSVEYSDKIKIYKANVDTSSQTLSKFGITGVPAILMFKDGELVDSHVGLRSKKDLVKDIEVVCNG